LAFDKAESKFYQEAQSKFCQACANLNIILGALDKNFEDVIWNNQLNKLMQQNMQRLFNACGEFFKLSQNYPEFVNTQDFRNMMTNLISLLNRSKWTNFAKINFTKQHNLFTLAKLIKAAVKELKMDQPAEIRQQLECDINAINNNIALYYLTHGDLRSAEVFLIRSTQDKMRGFSGLQAHVQLAHIKVTGLLKTKVDKEELFNVIQHNLIKICDEIQSIALDGLDTSLLFIANLRLYLKDITDDLIKHLEFNPNYREKTELILRLIFKIYLYLKNFSNHIPKLNLNNSDSLKLAAILLNLDTGLQGLTEILKKLPPKTTAQALTSNGSSIKPDLPKKKQQKQKSAASTTSSTDLPPAAPTNIDLNVKLATSHSEQETDSKAKTAESVPVITAPTDRVADITTAKPALSSNSKKATTTDSSYSPASTTIKPTTDISASNSLFKPQSSAAKAINSTSIPLISKNARPSPVLQPITSAYIPANSLAGVIPTGATTTIPEQLVTTFDTILARGKIVGSRGKGIKLVSKEKCQKYGISDNYIYKLKDPELDERLYGREATPKELKAMGIKEAHPYKKVIIFDLFIDSHKLQANKVKIVDFSLN